MELGIELYSLGVLCLVALAAGFIDAVAGGGGLLTVPSLLAAGLPPHLTLGTNKLASTFGSITSSITYFKKQLFNPKFWRDCSVATALGAIVGTLVVDAISTDALDKWLPVIIFLAALYSLFCHSKPDNHLSLPTQNSKLRLTQIVQGTVLGFYDGLAGPGTGAFWTVSNMALYKMNLLLCCGLARTMTFISNFFSLIAFVALGQVNFVLGLCMGGCMMVGSYIGAHSAIKFGNRFIRPIFIVVVMALTIKLALEAWY